MNLILNLYGYGDRFAIKPKHKEDLIKTPLNSRGYTVFDRDSKISILTIPIGPATHFLDQEYLNSEQAERDSILRSILYQEKFPHIVVPYHHEDRYGLTIENHEAAQKIKKGSEGNVNHFLWINRQNLVKLFTAVIQRYSTSSENVEYEIAREVPIPLERKIEQERLSLTFSLLDRVSIRPERPDPYLLS